MIVENKRMESGFFKSDQTAVTITIDEYEEINKKNEIYGTVLKRVASLYSDPYQRLDNIEDAISVIIKQTTNEKMIGKIGEMIYNQKRKKLEISHLNRFVVIDIDKQDIVAIENTPTKALIEAKKISDKHYFIRKVGKNISMN